MITGKESRSQLAGKAIFHWQNALELIIWRIQQDVRTGELDAETGDSAIRLAREKYGNWIRNQCNLLVEIELN